MIRQRNPSSTRDWQAVKIMMPGNVEREVVRIRRRGSDGVDRVMWAKAVDMSVSLSTPSVSGAVAYTTDSPVNTSGVTATVTGGEAPYTYSWSQASGSPASAQAPLNATTSFLFISVAPYETQTAGFVVVVTDRFGSTATSAVVSAQGSNFGDPGGPPPV